MTEAVAPNLSPLPEKGQASMSRGCVRRLSAISKTNLGALDFGLGLIYATERRWTRLVEFVSQIQK